MNFNEEMMKELNETGIVNEILNKLSNSAEELLAEQNDDLKPMRNAFIGLLRTRMVTEMDAFNKDDDLDHIVNLKLLLDVIQLLKKENE